MLYFLLCLLIVPLPPFINACDRCLGSTGIGCAKHCASGEMDATSVRQRWWPLRILLRKKFCVLLKLKNTRRAEQKGHHMRVQVPPSTEIVW